jgi:predicted transcriptional regulator
MIEKSVQLFTDKEEEFLNLLIGIGIHKTAAKILVYFVNNPEATLRDIELGVDVRLSEVSRATKYLTDQGWLRSWQIPMEKKPYWFKKFELAVSLTEIVASIEKQKKNEACDQVKLIKKIQNYI